MTYDDAIALIRKNAFNIRLMPYELLSNDTAENAAQTERLLRFVRKCHAWAIEAWMVDLPKDKKNWAKEITKNVWIDIGIVRTYEDIQ